MNRFCLSTRNHRSLVGSLYPPGQRLPDEDSIKKLALPILNWLLLGVLLVSAACSRNQEESPAPVSVQPTQAGESQAKSHLEQVLADPRTDSKLIEALQSYDVAQAERLLENGAILLEPGRHGRTPLMHATACGHLETLQAILAANPDVNAVDESGNTALFFMPNEDDPTVIRALLQAGASVQHRNQVGNSALFSAALLGHAQIVKILLNAGLKDDTPNRAGRNAFAEALLQGQMETADILRDTGSDLNPALRKNHNLLSFAAREGRLPAVRYLLEKGAYVNPDETNVRNALLEAVEKGHDHIVTLLLTFNVDLEKLNSDGKTPLQLAASLGHLDVVNALIAKGAQLENRGREASQSNALLLAAQSGHDRIADQLLKAGADVNGANRNQVTALMHAAFQGRIGLVQRLLQEPSMAVNNQSGDGHSALIYAVVKNHPDIVALLINHGADPNVETYIKAFGRLTPLALAVGRGYGKMAVDLLAAGAEVNVEVDVANFGRTTPLILATRNRYPQIVTALLARGANHELTDAKGFTALDWAKRNDDQTMVHLLLAEAAQSPSSKSPKHGPN